MRKVKNNAFILLALLVTTACESRDGVQENLSHSGDFWQCRLVTDIPLCLKAAQGDAVSQVDLGDIYYNGNGVPKSYEKAAYWFEKSAQQGDAEGQNNLAVLYRDGKGVEKSIEKSIYWLKKAVAQNNAMAQVSLGFAYEKGKGVPQSDKKAAELYRKSAEQGEVRGMTNLAYMYERGMGVEHSYEKAAYWYEKAAAKAYDRAQNNLGLLYLFGNGVKKSRKKAITLFKKAAEQGNKSSLLFAKLKYDERDIYANRLVKAIGKLARLNYPEKAEVEKHQGIVKLKFHLSGKGVISDIVVLKSSGYSELDQAAINAVQQLQRVSKPPEGFPSTLTVPIRYKIYRDDVGSNEAHPDLCGKC